MIPIDARRYAKALERVKLAMNAAGLSEWNRIEILSDFIQFWPPRSATAQEKHTQETCDRIAWIGRLSA